jgi:uncharacterized protein
MWSVDQCYATTDGSTVIDTEAGQSGRKSACLRTCIGCRTQGSRSDLLRVVLRTDSELPRVASDPRRCLPGRGAWIHPDPDCAVVAQRRQAFGRALRFKGQLDVSEVLATIRETGSGSKS